MVVEYTVRVMGTTRQFGIANAVLYISTTQLPKTLSDTYAIPLGSLSKGASTGQQLSFPFIIPAKSTVYVAVASDSASTVVVQLQFMNVPIK